MPPRFRRQKSILFHFCNSFSSALKLHMGKNTLQCPFSLFVSFVQHVSFREHPVFFRVFFRLLLVVHPCQAFAASRFASSHRRAQYSQFKPLGHRFEGSPLHIPAAWPTPEGCRCSEEKVPSGSIFRTARGHRPFHPVFGFRTFPASGYSRKAARRATGRESGIYSYCICWFQTRP